MDLSGSKEYFQKKGQETKEYSNQLYESGAPLAKATMDQTVQAASSAYTKTSEVFGGAFTQADSMTGGALNSATKQAKSGWGLLSSYGASMFSQVAQYGV